MRSDYVLGDRGRATPGIDGGRSKRPSRVGAGRVSGIGAGQGQSSGIRCFRPHRADTLHLACDECGCAGGRPYLATKDSGRAITLHLSTVDPFPTLRRAGLVSAL